MMTSIESFCMFELRNEQKAYPFWALKNCHMFFGASFVGKSTNNSSLFGIQCKFVPERSCRDNRLMGQLFLSIVGTRSDKKTTCHHIIPY